jgi:CubicO group peptidase (beta-lactamase class C family)
LAQPDAHPPIKTSIDTIFDMASITKSMTGILLMQSIEQGKLQLSQTVAALLPEAEKSPIAHTTLRQLATHTSGLPAWKPLYKSRSPLDEILHTPLETEPNTKYTYSDLGYILIGEIVARANGMPLDRLAHEQIYAPLGMKNSGYNPDRSLYPMIAATGHSRDREGETIIGVVHDENAHGLGGVAGHAGLFSSAPDMCRFALALQYPSSASHFGIPPILGTAARRTSQHSLIADSAVGSHGVGWFIWPNPYLPLGDLLSHSAFGHSGFTGTLLVVDPEMDVTLILLTNRVYYTGDGGGVLKLRRLFVNVALGAIVG